MEPPHSVTHRNATDSVLNKKKKKNKNKNQKINIFSPWKAEIIHKTQLIWNQQTREVISTQNTSHEHNSKDLSHLLSFSPGMQVNTRYINLGHKPWVQCESYCRQDLCCCCVCGTSLGCKLCPLFCMCVCGTSLGCKLCPLFCMCVCGTSLGCKLCPLFCMCALSLLLFQMKAFLEKKLQYNYRSVPEI